MLLLARQLHNPRGPRRRPSWVLHWQAAQAIVCRRRLPPDVPESCLPRPQVPWPGVTAHLRRRSDAATAQNYHQRRRWQAVTPHHYRRWQAATAHHYRRRWQGVTAHYHRRPQRDVQAAPTSARSCHRQLR